MGYMETLTPVKSDPLTHDLSAFDYVDEKNIALNVPPLVA